MPIHRHLKSFGTFRNQQVARSSRVTSSRNSPYQSIKPHQPLSGYLLRKACLFPVPRTPSSEKILVRSAVFPLPFPGGFYILSLTMACWFHRLRQPETDCERGTESGHRLVNRSIRSGSGAIPKLSRMPSKSRRCQGSEGAETLLRKPLEQHLLLVHTEHRHSIPAAIAAGIQELPHFFPPADCRVFHPAVGIFQQAGLLQIEHLYDQTLLGGEKGIEKAAGNPHRPVYLFHRGMLDSLGGDEFQGCGEQPFPDPSAVLF